MGKFNIKRFWLTFKWFFYENRGLIVKWSLGIMLGVTLLQMGLIGITSHSTTNVYGNMGTTPYQWSVLFVNSLCMAAAAIAIVVVNSNVFGMLKQKQKRIAFLTLPATNLERWTVAVVFAVIIIPACILAAYALGDLLRNIVFYIQGREWLYGFRFFFTQSSLGRGVSIATKVFEFAVMAWVVSIYVLAGTWFTKAQFVIATFFHLALSTLVGYLSTIFKSEILSILAYGIKAGQDGLLGYGIIAFIFALAIFNFWLSYRIFTRFQLITSKWTNV